MVWENTNLMSKGEDRDTLKKPYGTPRLMVYGSIDEITAAAGTTGADGLAGSSLV